MRTEKWAVILCSLIEVCRQSRAMLCYATSIKYSIVSSITSLLTRRFCVNLRRDKKFSLLYEGEIGRGSHANFLLNACWRLFSYDKAAESEADLSHTFSADIENEWSNTSTPPMT